jgi:hypothetical protein
MNTRKEEIEKASVEYQMEKMPMAIGGAAFDDMIYRMNINPSFIAGAEWADDTMLKKVIAWLRLHMDDSIVNGRDIGYIYDDLQQYIQK